ncbi:Uncharacterised protein [Vibrio cholerae]|nr:Uncharacterised protein [Vibrio cholerae]CSH96215.1 Uncharacterised protein [Vibrio cholerae]
MAGSGFHHFLLASDQLMPNSMLILIPINMTMLTNGFRVILSHRPTP